MMAAGLVLVSASEGVSGVSADELQSIYNRAMRIKPTPRATVDVWAWHMPDGYACALGLTPDAARESAIVSVLEVGCAERTTVEQLRREVEHTARGSASRITLPTGRRGLLMLDDTYRAWAGFPGLLQVRAAVRRAR